MDSIEQLNLHKPDLEVIDFYENTAIYKLNISVEWNPIFKFGGFIISQLFSNRIDQLNIPTKDIGVKNYKK